MINWAGANKQDDQRELGRLVKEMESLLAWEKQVNEQLRESEKIYRILVETSPDVIILSDINANIIMANHQAAVMYGVDNKDFFVEKNLFDFIVPEDRERARKDFKMLLVDCSTKSARYSILKKDSSPCPIEMNTSLVFNDSGKPKALVSICRDITDRIFAENSLIESEKRGRLITDNILDTIIICDSRFRYKYASPAFERIMGIPCEEIVGQRVLGRVHPDDLPGVMAVVKNAISTRSWGRVVYRYKSAGGQYLWFESAGQILLDRDGNITGAVIANREITERKQKEREMASLDRFNLVGQMAVGIGHEIRNPMTTVRGLLQILKSKKGCQDYTEYFNIMIEELDRANSIITEFLTIARNKPVDLKWANLNSIIRTLFPLMNADAVNSGKNITLVTGDIPDLQLNEKEIRQLMLNLVRNGLEAMEPGGELIISTYSEGGGVVLTVKDQGKGIEPGLLKKIGTPFFTTKESGTGLGLAVCHGVAARHGAVIDVETGSAGTTFLVYFKNEGAGPC